MYEAVNDPYCYEDSNVLKNKFDIREGNELEELEAQLSLIRAEEPLPAGLLDVAHYRAVHHHLFQDVYEWAGEFRTVRISKGATQFCYPENIESSTHGLFEAFRQKAYFTNLPREEFITNAAAFLAELNAIHPFREGNGRTQLSFLALLADHAGYHLNMEHLTPESFLMAMIVSFSGNEQQLTEELSRIVD